MTLTQLRYLAALADHGHFGRAAAACNVSQPTLSAQIKKLETHLGARLIERGAAGAALTPIGEAVLTRARRVLEEAEGLVEAARRGRAALSGPRRIGVIPTLCPYLLPWALPALGAAFPALELILHEDLTDNLLAQLQRRRIDLAIVAAPIDEARIVATPLFDEPFFAALPARHPLARAPTVPQGALARERVLLLAEGHCLREQALAICARPRAAAAGRVDAAATSLETLRGLVAAGHGVTLLPALAARDARDVALRPIDPPAARRILLLAREGSEQADEIAPIAEALRGRAPALVEADADALAAS